MTSITTGRKWRRLCLPLAALVVAVPLAAAEFSLETGSVTTSGIAPDLTKTATLKITNGFKQPIENVVATLEEPEGAAYSVIEGTVEVPLIGVGETVESADTFSVEVDVSNEISRHVPMRWLVEFELDGESRQLRTPSILVVVEMDE
jgi:hypothetical protein